MGIIPHRASWRKGRYVLDLPNLTIEKGKTTLAQMALDNEKSAQLTAEEQEAIRGLAATDFTQLERIPRNGSGWANIIKNGGAIIDQDVNGDISVSYPKQQLSVKINPPKTESGIR